jgi:hypothetical protein
MRRDPVFAAILMLLLGAGLAGSRSQPGIAPFDLLQIADGHLCAARHDRDHEPRK